MKYEEALKRWGAAKLEIDDWQNVNVDFDIDEGFSCCGGNDPDCYCSYATSPSFEVVVTALGGRMWSESLQYEMHTFLQELFEVSEQ
jgi:hypothetical protein